MATRTAGISGVLARTSRAMRPGERAEIRDLRPPHRSPRSSCAAVNAAISLAPGQTTHSRHTEWGLRVSCACQFRQASPRHAARCGWAGRPVRLRSSAPPLCRASASAGVAFRCPRGRCGVLDFRTAAGSSSYGPGTHTGSEADVHILSRLFELGKFLNYRQIKKPDFPIS